MTTILSLDWAICGETIDAAVDPALWEREDLGRVVRAFMGRHVADALGCDVTTSLSSLSNASTWHAECRIENGEEHPYGERAPVDGTFAINGGSGSYGYGVEGEVAERIGEAMESAYVAACDHDFTADLDKVA